MMREAYRHHTRKAKVDHRDAAECTLALADGCIAAGDIETASILLRRAKALILVRARDGKAV